jgi:hypothetical protein
MNIGIHETLPGITGQVKITFQNIHTGAERVSEYHNLVVTAGKNMIASRLAGTANDCNITYVAVGTNATAPAIGDTTLGTELARNTVTSITASGATVLVIGFFGAAEAIGTLTEMAWFGEAATAAANSGTMFNHAAITEIKTASETMTIEGTITIA